MNSALVSIHDLNDPRLDDYRAVTDAELLGRRGLFMAEGRFVVRTLLNSVLYRPKSILLTPAALESLRDVIGSGGGGKDGSPIAPCPVFTVSPDLMNEVAGFHIHRGCLAAGERPARLDAGRLLASLAPGPATVVVLEGLLNHDNVGGVFRNAAAFGARAVLLTPGCVDPLYRKAIRVSMGAALQVPFAHLEGGAAWRQWASLLREHGFHVVAMTPGEDAIDIREFSSRRAAPERVALLLGSEGPGLTGEALACADLRVRIAIAPEVDSLNVAAASAIALHAFPVPGRVG